MAISFREYPWYLQALVFFALALVIIGAGEYLPMSPVTAIRNSVAENHTKDSQLNREVDELQVYERRNAEFKLEMASLEKQLETLKTIVPEEKELDEFIRLLQGAAAASGVQIRTPERQRGRAQGLSLRIAIRNLGRWPLLQHRGFLFPGSAGCPGSSTWAT